VRKLNLFKQFNALVGMEKRLMVVVFVLVVVILLGFSFYLFIGYDSGDSEINAKEGVAEVIDGDTFRLDSGEVVRLICVDTPEKGKAGYEEAKTFLEGLLLNNEIRLESDVDDKDSYGRLLRYVYVTGVNGEVFVNKEIVSGGFGSVFRYGNDTARCGEIGEANN